jgi:hypothetical protein
MGGIINILSAVGSSVATGDCDLTAIGWVEASGGGPTELSPEGLVLELLDSQEIEGGYTMRESLKVILSALAGKLSGAGTTTISIRDVNDTVTRITASVDSNGNRAAVTLDVD